MKPPIGAIIKERVEAVGISKSKLARRLHMTPANVYKIFKRSTVDVLLLCRLGEALNYDFIAHYSLAVSKELSVEPLVLKRVHKADAKVVYTYSLRKKIAQLADALRELAVEESEKTQGQLFNELDFIQDMLAEIRANISSRK